MKKIAALLLALLFCVSAAQAEKTPCCEEIRFENILFENAKEALRLIANEEYESALELLDFKEGAPSAKDFSMYIHDTFLTLEEGELQYEVAVAYYDGHLWTLAIPLYAPESEEVETFLFFSEDGVQFIGCGYMPWGEVEEQYAPLYDVIWNVEYCPEDAVILLDEGKGA